MHKLTPVELYTVEVCHRLSIPFEDQYRFNGTEYIPCIIHFKSESINTLSRFFFCEENAKLYVYFSTKIKITEVFRVELLAELKAVLHWTPTLCLHLHMNH